MKIAFFKNPKKTQIVPRIICWWTKKKHYHCELYFSWDAAFSADAEVNEIRFKNQRHGDDIDLIELNLTQEEEFIIYKFCLKENYSRYDWMGILLSQFIKLRRQSKTKWFCSELCVAALQQIGWFYKLKPYEYDPGDVFNLINERIECEKEKSGC